MADDETTATAPSGPRLEPGQRVQVRSGLDGTWQDGFAVAEVTGTGYRLRRDTDGSLLPEVPHDRVRRERRRETWWI